MAPHGFLQWCIRSFCQGVVCFRRMRTGACGVARRLSPTGRPGVPNGGAQRSIAVMVHALLARRPTQRPGAPTVGPSGLLQSWPRSFCQGAVCFRRVRPGAREVTRRMPTAGRPGAPNVRLSVRHPGNGEPCRSHMRFGTNSKPEVAWPTHDPKCPRQHGPRMIQNAPNTHVREHHRAAKKG